MKPSFSDYSLKTGLVQQFNQLEDSLFPSTLYHIIDNVSEFKDKPNTLFGFVYDETVLLVLDEQVYNLQKGMYFSIPINRYERVKLLAGKCFLAERENYEGFFYIGGKVEEKGRLKYIDGCTDSLLIPPIRLGDPCLNLLVFPVNTNQTPHTHPSIRLGVVIKGKGFCITPQGEIPLYEGQVFAIHTNQVHAFRTEQEEMHVIAYHPDSDFGPEDEFHPMINRTIVGGISANQLKSIQTVE